MRRNTTQPLRLGALRLGRVVKAVVNPDALGTVVGDVDAQRPFAAIASGRSWLGIVPALKTSKRSPASLPNKPSAIWLSAKFPVQRSGRPPKESVSAAYQDFMSGVRWIELYQKRILNWTTARGEHQRLRTGDDNMREICDWEPLTNFRYYT